MTLNEMIKNLAEAILKIENSIREKGGDTELLKQSRKLVVEVLTDIEKSYKS